MADSALEFSYQKKENVQELFRGITKAYDSMLRCMTLDRDRYWKRLLLSLALLKRGQQVVDAAAGTGVLSYQIGTLVGPWGAVLGSDICLEMLRVARLKQRALGVSKLVEFSLAAAEELPLENGSADRFTSCYLFKYCEIPRTFREAFRILKVGGRFVGYDFTRPSSGAFGRLLSAYIFRGMPLLSKMPFPQGTRKMLRDLPAIIASSDWNDRIRDAATAAGFRNLKMFTATSGVVTFVCCEKL